MRFALITIFLLFTLGSCRSSESGLAPGNVPPAIELADLNGNVWKLSQLQGKLVLVNFWASWCGPCLAEMPALERLYVALKDRGFIVLGVGVRDKEQALRELSGRLGISFPVLLDRDGVVSERYDLAGFPESFLVGPDGKLVLFIDFPSNQPVVRIIGPREWDTPTMRSRIESLLPVPHS